MAVSLKRCLCTAGRYSESRYDVVISGGGMVGSTLACALAKTPILKEKSVLLIENSSPPRPISFAGSRPYSNRVSAINPKSRRVFEDCGMWKHIENGRYNAITDIKVWGEYSQLSTTFSPLPDEDLAYIIENDLIVDAATKELDSSKNVTVKYDCKVNDVVLSEDKPTVILDDGTRIKCDLLVGADGANSLIRRKLGYNYLSFDYNQFGIVATLEVSVDGSNNVAWQKFVKNGPIALLPLNDRFSSLVWSTSRDEASVLSELSDDHFIDALNSSLNAPSKNDPVVSSVQRGVQSVLNGLNMATKQKELMPPYVSSIQPSSRAKFPLSFGHSSQYVSNNVCLVGDAAHKVHPLAGQGVNLGYNDIHLLRDILRDSVRDGRPLGNIKDLQRYEASSLKHNVPIMAGINLFHFLFVNNCSPLKAIGNSSFLIADSFVPLKNIMKRLASN